MRYDQLPSLEDTLDASNTTVLAWSLVILSIIVGALFFIPETTVDLLTTGQDLLLTDGAAVFIVAMGFIICISVVFAFRPAGRIRLGGPDAEPTYNNLTYLAVLFTAGIAAGIVFFGPAEAVLHQTNVWGVPNGPIGHETTAGAVGYTIIHWGIVTWASYAIIALPVAYYSHRQEAPLRVSSALYPLVRHRQLTAATIDILAVVATVLGVATSTGSVTDNFLAGITYQWGVQFSDVAVLMLVGAVTLVFVTSSMTGIYRGIRRLSFIATGMFLIILIVTFVFGPTREVLSIATRATSQQPAQFASLIGTFGGSWGAAWTVFYWAVWFSWAPSVGLFIARISRGRTIREMLGYSVVATGLVTSFWFYIIGGSVVHLQSSGKEDILGAIQEAGPAVAGYPLFVSLPLGDIVLFLFLGLGLSFLITSSDSASLAVAMVSSENNTDPPLSTRVLWGSIIAILSVILIVLGGTAGHQALAVFGGAIFAVVGSVAVLLLFHSLVTTGAPEVGVGDAQEVTSEDVSSAGTDNAPETEAEVGDSPEA